MRAGSMKYISSQAADVAAVTLDGALTIADEYVDRYLPPDPADKVGENKDGKIVARFCRFKFIQVNL